MKIEFWLTEHLDTLTKFHVQGKFSHAFLVYGQEGVGKTRLLELLSERLLCTELGEGLEACGRCCNCQLVKCKTHPDFKNLAVDESSIKIADVRGLNDFVHQSSHQSSRRVILISSVERLTTAAANGLLKMLEEPPENTHFLLSTDKPHRLLPTIRSRCQQYLLAKPKYELAHNWLVQAGFEQEAVEASLQLAAGAPLKAVALMQGQGLDDHQKINQALSRLMLGQSGPIETAKILETIEQAFVFESLTAFVERSLRQDMGFDNGDKKLADLALKRQSKPLNIEGIFEFLDLLMSQMKTAQSSIHLNQRLMLDELMVAFSSHLRT